MLELASFRRATHIFILVMNINVQLPKITSARTTFVNWRVGVQMPNMVSPSAGGWDEIQEKQNDFLKIHILNQVCIYDSLANQVLSNKNH